jgi:hypothetical protein
MFVFFCIGMAVSLPILPGIFVAMTMLRGIV